MNKRQLLSENNLLAAIKDVEDKLIFRAKQKGLGAMASNHEILGIIDDELQEYRDEVHAKSKDEKKIEELKDIAVAAIFGIASIKSGGTDW